MNDLLRAPLGQLKQRYLDESQEVPEEVLQALEADARQGARVLAQKLRARKEAEKAELRRIEVLSRFEVELWAAGHQYIAGVDEAGMAPLAGPVVAAAAILPRNFKLPGLDDSKKVGDPRKREALGKAIQEQAICWAVGRAEVEEIDQLNIYHAGLLAMRRAVEALSPSPHYLLVDARTLPRCPIPQRGIIQGDALSVSIAAASILAKTTRDRWMMELDAQYPGYGLAAHKGYPTAQHVQAIQEKGVLPIHRRSFAPVREAEERERARVAG